MIVLLNDIYKSIYKLESITVKNVYFCNFIYFMFEMLYYVFY